MKTNRIHHVLFPTLSLAGLLFSFSLLAKDFSKDFSKDNRQELKMTQEMKDFQLATMRKSLDHSANFILALQKKDFKKLKEIVKEFGHTPEKKKLSQGIEARNPGFKNMAKAHQKSVKRLKAFVEEENADKSLKQFGLVMKTCVQCHSLYKTVVVP